MKQLEFHEMNAGDIVYPDDGFTCIKLNTSRTIKKDKSGALFFYCDSGKHFLEMDCCSGLSREPWKIVKSSTQQVF